MNTLENNKLIAEFMELPFIKEDGETNYIKDLIHVPDYELSYHEDWNWLMEVVEKIETKKYYKKEVQFSITKYSVKIQTLTNEDGLIISPCVFSSWGTYGGTEKMKAVYNACLEFIKWYNAKNS